MVCEILDLTWAKGGFCPEDTWRDRRFRNFLLRPVCRYSELYALCTGVVARPVAGVRRALQKSRKKGAIQALADDCPR